MNKLSLVILGLAIFGACFYVVRAEEDKDELKEELSEADDFGPDGEGKLREIFGTKDVIQKGVGLYQEGKVNECANAKNEEKCETCCKATGKASSYERDLKKIHKFRSHTCYCFAKNNAY